MKAKSVVIGIAAAAIVLLFLSITAVSRVLSASPGNLSRGVTAQPVAATFLPKRSPLVASFLVNPDRLSLSAQLSARPGDRAALRHEIHDFKQAIKQSWALDYDKDVKPWVGNEVTFAVTTPDLDRQPDNGLQPGYLLALAIDKPAVAKKSVEAFWQRQAIAGMDLAFEQYQGVPFIYATPTSKYAGLTATILGKFVLLANDPKAIRNAINDIQVPDLALASVSSYQNSLDQLLEAHIGIAFVNLAELGRWGTGNKALPTNFANLPESGITLGFGLDRAGVKGETLLTLESLSKLPAITSNTSAESPDNKALQVLPQNSSLIVGRNMQQTWQQISTALQPYPELATFFHQAIANVASHLGLNLEEDIFNWVRGDYAIGLLPLADKAPDWVFVAQKTNTEDAKAAIAQLDDRARSKGKLTVGNIEVNGDELTVWTRLSAVSVKSDNKASITGTVAAVRSQTPDLVSIANSVEAIEATELSLASDRKGMTKSDNYKAIAATLPRNYQSYAYIDKQIDLAALVPDTELLKPLRNAVTATDMPIVKHIKAITLASTASNPKDSPNVRRGQIFFTLK
jgi:Protein of unknown function (DUF3352)